MVFQRLGVRDRQYCQNIQLLLMKWKIIASFNVCLNEFQLLFRCAICTESRAKYRCPRCSLETCCLQCVNKHKTDAGCTGERDKTAYVKVGDFKDINLLNGKKVMELNARTFSKTDKQKNSSNFFLYGC